MTWTIGILVTLLVAAVGACLTMLGWILSSRDKVSLNACEAKMNASKLAHNQYCPENRRVMTKVDHDAICDLKLHPIQTTLNELKTEIQGFKTLFTVFAEEQSVCRDNVHRWINEALASYKHTGLGGGN